MSTASAAASADAAQADCLSIITSCLFGSAKSVGADDGAPLLAPGAASSSNGASARTTSRTAASFVLPVLIALIPVIDMATDVIVSVAFLQAGGLYAGLTLLLLLSLAWRALSLYVALSPEPALATAFMLCCPFLVYPSFTRLIGVRSAHHSMVKDLYDAAAVEKAKMDDADVSVDDIDGPKEEASLDSIIGADVAARAIPSPAIPTSYDDNYAAPALKEAISLWDRPSFWKREPDTIDRALYGPELPLLRRFLTAQHDAFMSLSQARPDARFAFVLVAESQLLLIGWVLGPLLIWRAAVTLAIHASGLLAAEASDGTEDGAAAGGGTDTSAGNDVEAAAVPGGGGSAAAPGLLPPAHVSFLQVVVCLHAALQSAPQLVAQSAAFLLCAQATNISLSLYLISVGASLANMAAALSVWATHKSALVEILRPPTGAFERQAVGLASGAQVHATTLLSAIVAADDAGVEMSRLLGAITRLREQRVSEVRARHYAKGEAFGSIRADGYLIEEAKAADFGAGEMKAAGFGAIDLIASGYTAAEMCDDFEAAELRSAGVGVEELAAVGYGAPELRAAGFHDAKELSMAGVSSTSLRLAAFTLAELREAGLTATELREADFSLEELAALDGIEAAELVGAGFDDAAALRTVGFDAAALRSSGGFSLEALKEAGFDVTALRGAGFTLTEMHEVGFSLPLLREAGFGDAAEFRTIGVTPRGLLSAEFSLGELREAGYSAKELRDAGGEASPLKDAGFTLRRLREAEFSASELKASGFDLLELKKVGFEPSELQLSRLDPTLLRGATFTMSELSEAGLLGGGAGGGPGAEDPGTRKASKSPGKMSPSLKKSLLVARSTATPISKPNIV